MPHSLPEVVDAWRMVARGERLSGTYLVSAMPRLVDSLESDRGSVDVTFRFDRTRLRTPCLEIEIRGTVVLECRRTQQPFEYELDLQSLLALVRDENEAESVEGELEPCVVSEQGLRLRDVVEDEMILALPIMPLSPAAMNDDEPLPYGVEETPEAVREVSPFAVLKKLRSAPDKD